MRFRFLILFLLTAPLPLVRGATTINATNKYAYGANIGWMDWRGDTNNGAAIGEYVCSGYIYAANVGWINLGSGSPANGIQYQNLAATDFGVNQDGFGNLRGYAYGANVGWLDFENTGAPKVDLKNGRISGFIWSANCGWISLSNTAAYVQTDTITAGTDSDHNGLADAWELQHFGHLGVNPNADADGDGMSNRQEYLAGTDPNNSLDNLRITGIFPLPFGSKVALTWTSVANRCYFIQKRLDLIVPDWFDSGLGPIPPDAGGTTSRSILDTNAPVRFYRVRAFQPLTP